MMIVSKLSLLLAGAIASTASAAHFEGYIMDNQCVELCKETTSDSPCTPDTSNAFYSPQRHTGWCLQLQVCIDSGYSLMSLEPDESGRHSILMAFAGDESQQAVLDYVKAGSQGQFPRVVVSYNETSVDLQTDADPIPQIFDAVISDPWGDDDDVYSGEDTSQKVCSDASEADIDSNNYCFRSDVVVKAGSKGMIVIESNGCPDHDNMLGGSGLITTTQEEPAFEGGNVLASCCASGCGGCTSCSDKECASCCASGCCGGCTSCSAEESASCCASGCGCGSSTTCAAEEETSCCASGCGCGSSTTCAAEEETSCCASGCGCGSSTTCAAEEGTSCCASGCGGSSTTCAAETGTSCCASGCGGSSTTCSATTCSAEEGTSCCASGCCGSNGDRKLECASSCADELGACSAKCCADTSNACEGCVATAACGTSCGCCGCGCGCGGGECGDCACHGHSHPKIGTHDPVFHHYTIMIPSEPGAPGKVTALQDEVVGIMTNGVLLDAHKQTWSYDICNGHSDTKHQYHYHMPPICYLKSMGVEFADEHSWWIDEDEVRDFAEMKNMFPQTAPSSAVIGFALDGYPIYGPYDNAGNRMSSSAYGGDVDECNGKEDSDGNYGYYLTVDPPFAPPCLRGNKGAFAYAATDKVCPRNGISNTIVGLPVPEPESEETSEEEVGVEEDSSGSIDHALSSLFATLLALAMLV